MHCAGLAAEAKHLLVEIGLLAEHTASVDIDANSVPDCFMVVPDVFSQILSIQGAYQAIS